VVPFYILWKKGKLELTPEVLNEDSLEIITFSNLQMTNDKQTISAVDDDDYYQIILTRVPDTAPPNTDKFKVLAIAQILSGEGTLLGFFHLVSR